MSNNPGKLREMQIEILQSDKPWWNSCFTCAGETITGVSRVTGAVEAVRYVDTGSMFTASSIVLGAFIHICVLYHTLKHRSALLTKAQFRSTDWTHLRSGALSTLTTRLNSTQLVSEFFRVLNIVSWVELSWVLSALNYILNSTQLPVALSRALWMGSFPA